MSFFNHAPQAATAIPANAAHGAEQSSSFEQVDELVRSNLNSLVWELWGKAELLYNKGRELFAETDCEAAQLADHAKTQADTIRSTADQVNAELNATSNGPGGKNKMTASQAAKYSYTMKDMSLKADVEKNALNKAIAEAKSPDEPSKHTITKWFEGKSSSTPSPALKRTRDTFGGATAAAVVEAPANSFSSWIHHVRDTIRRPTSIIETAQNSWNQISTRAAHFVERAQNTAADLMQRSASALERGMQTVSHAANEFTNTYISQPLAAASEAISTTYTALETKLEQGLASAKQTVVQAATTAQTVVSNAVSQAANSITGGAKQMVASVASGLATAKTLIDTPLNAVAKAASEAKQKIGSLLSPSEKKPEPPIAKPAPKPVRTPKPSCMRTAMASAASLTLPACLLSQAAEEIDALGHTAMQNLPKITSLFDQIHRAIN